MEPGTFSVPLLIDITPVFLNRQRNFGSFEA
jgi:hypothetical protein